MPKAVVEEFKSEAAGQEEHKQAAVVQNINQQEDDEEDEEMTEEDLQKTLNDEGVKMTLSVLTGAMKQHTQAAKKGDEADKKVGAMFEKLSKETEMLVAKKMEKAKSLGNFKEDGYLDHMTPNQIAKLVLAFLPFIKIKEGLYMIGTEKKPVQVKSNTLMIRVGGGYFTLE